MHREGGREEKVKWGESRGREGERSFVCACWLGREQDGDEGCARWRGKCGEINVEAVARAEEERNSVDERGEDGADGE